MAAIYILSDYGKLSKKDETIVFSQPDGTSTILFPFKTEQLVLMGNVSISGDALRLLTKYKIPTTLLSSNGRFNGKLTFGDSKNVFLRQKQYAVLSDGAASLEIAKSIVEGKIRNQICFMQRIKRKSDGFGVTAEKTVQNAVERAKRFLADCERAESIEKLRGFEGIAAKSYFEVFALNIQPEWAVFKGRSKNPPKSNVNAVLSFLYTLLMYRVESALETQGLDVCCGNLHALNYGKSALVFDLMEEFRTPVADSVCCSLFNLGILNPDDFHSQDFSCDNDEYPLDAAICNDDSEKCADNESSLNVKGVLLTKDGLKKVIGAFEDKMDSLIVYQPTAQKLSYAKIIYEQAAHYRRVVSGEEMTYKAYVFK